VVRHQVQLEVKTNKGHQLCFSYFFFFPDFDTIDQAYFKAFENYTDA